MIIGVCVVAILWPSALTSGDPTTGVAPEHLLPPDSAHWCGTDQLGRDVLTRIIYGARETLPAAFVATMTGIVLGSVIGGFAALSGPAVDMLLSGVIDVLLAIPELLLALTVVILTGFGPVHAALAVGISQTAGFARIVRNLVQTLRSQTYIEAARLSGTGFWGIVGWHILPNAFRPLLGMGSCAMPRPSCPSPLLAFLDTARPRQRRNGAHDFRRTGLSGHSMVDDHIPWPRPADRRSGSQPPEPGHDERRGRTAMTSPAPVLDVNDLAISYGDRIAVNGVSFTALPGKTTALIGESGSENPPSPRLSSACYRLPRVLIVVALP